MNHTFSAKNVVVAYRGGARALRQFDLDFSGKCLASRFTSDSLATATYGLTCSGIFAALMSA